MATTRRSRPANSIEGRENQLIALAVDLAEEQLRNKTASAQVITHYLKLGTTREKLEKEKLESENALLRAKTDNIANSRHEDDYYVKVLDALRDYRGSSFDTRADDYEDEDLL